MRMLTTERVQVALLICGFQLTTIKISPVNACIPVLSLVNREVISNFEYIEYLHE